VIFLKKIVLWVTTISNGSLFKKNRQKKWKTLAAVPFGG
jgi:hypothetical protein